jgi:hypothetical protein
MHGSNEQLEPHTWTEIDSGAAEHNVENVV